MKLLTPIKSAPLPTLENILFFENEKGIKLPNEFKLYLSTQNLIQSVEKYYINGDGERFEIHQFYPFHNSDSLSLNNMYEITREIFLDKFMPFGDDSGGWLYLIGIVETNFGQIFLCRPDEGLEGIKLLEENFEDFIEKIVLDNE